MSIAIGTLLVVLGGAYVWWWNLPLKETGEIAMGSPTPKSRAELNEHFPHFARACRAIDEDPLAPSENPSEDAMRISGRIYRRCGQHALAGIVSVAIGIALPIGSAISNRKKKKSEQEVAPYR